MELRRYIIKETKEVILINFDEKGIALVGITLPGQVHYAAVPYEKLKIALKNAKKEVKKLKSSINNTEEIGKIYFTSKETLSEKQEQQKIKESTDKIAEILRELYNDTGSIMHVTVTHENTAVTNTYQINPK